MYKNVVQFSLSLPFIWRRLFFLYIMIVQCMFGDTKCCYVFCPIYAWLQGVNEPVSRVAMHGEAALAELTLQALAEPT